jgi:hypothetical protein
MRGGADMSKTKGEKGRLEAACEGVLYEVQGELSSIIWEAERKRITWGEALHRYSTTCLIDEQSFKHAAMQRFMEEKKEECEEYERTHTHARDGYQFGLPREND